MAAFHTDQPPLPRPEVSRPSPEWHLECHSQPCGPRVSGSVPGAGPPDSMRLGPACSTVDVLLLRARTLWPVVQIPRIDPADSSLSSGCAFPPMGPHAFQLKVALEPPGHFSPQGMEVLASREPALISPAGYVTASPAEKTPPTRGHGCFPERRRGSQGL